MEKTLKCVAFVWFCLLYASDEVCGSHFRGGLITWAPVHNQADKIAVSWQLSWNRVTHSCDQDTINSGTLIGEGQLCLVRGNGTKCISAETPCTDFSEDGVWSSGSSTEIFNISTGSNKTFTLRYESCCWVNLLNGQDDWLLESYGDLALRPDHTINTSPATSMSPVLTLAPMSRNTITIPIIDMDGDNVRCRWDPNFAKPPSHVLTLNSATCTLTFTSSDTGFWGIAILIEDFFTTFSATPLSRVALHFVIDVKELPTGCSGVRPSLVPPTPERGVQFPIFTDSVFTAEIWAQASLASTPFTDITLVVSPEGMTKSSLVQRDNNKKSISVQWTPGPSQEGPNILCVSAFDMCQWSDQTCITLFVQRADPCFSYPCQNGGTCVSNRTAHDCHCIEAYIGNFCEIPICLEETTNVQEMKLSWPATSVNVTADSNERCSLPTSRAGYGIAYRACILGVNGTAIWGDPEMTNCGPEEDINLEKLIQTPVVKDNAVEIGAVLRNVTGGLTESDILPQNISDIADVMMNIVEVASGDPKVTTSVVGICSNIITATKNNENEGDLEQHYLTLLNILNDQIRRSTELRHTLTPVIEPNLVVTVMNINPNRTWNESLTFDVRQKSEGKSFHAEDITTEGSNDNNRTRISILLPSVLFRRASNDNKDNVGVGITVHNSDILFPTDSQNGEVVVGDVIAADIAGISNLTNIEPPVEIQFMAPGNKPTCVFWNFDKQSWSSEGCEFKGRSPAGNILCHCDHLTNFAVIADIENPVLGRIVNITNNTDPGVSTATVTWVPPAASDNSGSVNLTSNHDPGDSFPIGVTEVIYTAVDPSGNENMIMFSIIITDKEKPVVSELPSITVNADIGQPGAVVSWQPPIASDNSDQVNVSSNYNPGDVFPLGNSTIVYTATDASGNVETMLFIITVIDNEKPVLFNIPNTTMVNTTLGKPTGTVTWIAPTAVDNSRSVTLTANHDPGDAFPIGETRVRYTATDPSGNIAYAEFWIRVIDNESPQLVSGCPTFIEEFTEELSFKLMWSDPKFIDNSGEKVEVNSTHTSPFVFELGNMHDIIYYAEDKQGNSAGCIITVNITAACFESTAMLPSGNFSWPLTRAENQTVDSNERCDVRLENRGRGQAARVCEFSRASGGSRWLKAMDQDCGIKEEPDLEELSETPVVEDNLENVAEALNNATEVLEDPTPEDIENVAETFSNIVEVGTATPEVTTVVVEIIDNLVSSSDDTSELDEGSNMNDQNTPHYQNILMAFEEQVIKATSLEQNISVVEPNIVLTTTTVNPQTQSNVGISFTVSSNSDNVDGEEDDDLSNKDVGINKDVPEEEIRSSISLPASLFNATDDIDCYTNVNGTDYRGKVLMTVNGKTCQDWTSQTPHNHSWTAEEFPNSGLGDHNYCRNPGGIRSSAWCLTTHPNTIWEYCDIGEPQPSCNGTIFGVSFVVHRSDTLFPSNSTNQTRIVGGDIISAIVIGVEDASNLSDPVVLEFTTQGENATCVFWDFNILDWSSTGCRLNTTITSDVRTRVTCHCYHLTNFAVLVDFNQDNPPHIILEIVSKIGCGLSMFTLFLTVAIFLGFRRLRTGIQATPRKILIQLCISLFFLYLLFLAGIDQTKNSGGCAFVAALLQFLTLASLMWMGVESFNMYLNVVRVFDAQPQHFLLKASIVAWGAPMLVTVISLGAGHHHYQHGNYCFVSTGLALYCGVILPIGLILIHNVIMFSMVMHSLWKANLGGNVTHHSKAHKISQRLQNAFLISILMGLTWVFGFFAIEDVEFTFSLIFCLCNSFQGVAIFILFCIRQDDVRKTLRPYFRRIFRIPDSVSHRSETASTGVLSSSATQSTKSPYSDTDFSVTAMPSAKVFGAICEVEGDEPRANKPPDHSAEYDTTLSTLESKFTMEDGEDKDKDNNSVESTETTKEPQAAAPEEGRSTGLPLKNERAPTEPESEDVKALDSGKDVSISTSAKSPDEASDDSVEMTPLLTVPVENTKEETRDITQTGEDVDFDESEDGFFVAAIDIEEDNAIKDAVIELDEE